MTANDGQDSMRQTVWRLSKLATSPYRLLTANGFLDRLRVLVHARLFYVEPPAPDLKAGQLRLS